MNKRWAGKVQEGGKERHTEDAPQTHGHKLKMCKESKPPINHTKYLTQTSKLVSLRQRASTPRHMSQNDE